MEENFWMPSLEFSSLCKSGETYWPVDALEKDIVVVICKNGEISPPLVPPPTVTVVPYSPPVQQNNTTSYIHEQDYAMKNFLLGCTEEGKNFTVEEIATEIAKRDLPLLMLIKISCLEGNSERALNLCSLLRLKKSVMIAIKTASGARMSSLSEKMESFLVFLHFLSFSNCFIYFIFV